MIGYLRCSTAEQVDGYSLQAQKQRIREVCSQRDWRVDAFHSDKGVSGKSLDRPELLRALEKIAKGRSDGLIVAKLDRLSRSVVDFGNLLQWFEHANARLVALDLDIDTGTASGRLVANVFAAVAAWELETIQERTRAGLRARRANGLPISRPSVHDRPELVERVRELREQKLTYDQICVVLNESGVETLRGGVCWRPSALQAVLSPAGRRRPRRMVELPEVKR